MILIGKYYACIFQCIYRKAERKITFEQFQEAVKLLAEIKYPGDPNGVRKITTKLMSDSSGPVVSGATVSDNSHCLLV